MERKALEETISSYPIHFFYIIFNQQKTVSIIVRYCSSTYMFEIEISYYIFTAPLLLMENHSLCGSF